MLLDLHARLSEIKVVGGEGVGVRHELEMLFRKGSLKPSDDSPFANEIFDPECESPIIPFLYSLLCGVRLSGGADEFELLCAATNMMYNLGSRKTREFVRREYKNTNYGVVNPRTIDTVRLLLSPFSRQVGS